MLPIFEREIDVSSNFSIIATKNQFELIMVEKNKFSFYDLNENNDQPELILNYTSIQNIDPEFEKCIVYDEYEFIICLFFKAYPQRIAPHIIKMKLKSEQFYDSNQETSTNQGYYPIFSKNSTNEYL
jgi:hypothetical protein